jgi:phosphoribosylformylglycinamidine cyclo-ligase
VGQAILSSTRIYAPIIKRILATVGRRNISAMIHCTGGGQTKCLGFAKNAHIIKDNLFPTPALFSLIQKHSQESWENMYKTFNMGCGFEIYTDKRRARKIIEVSEGFGVDAEIIGHVVPAKKNKLTIKSPYGNFVY